MSTINDVQQQAITYLERKYTCAYLFTDINQCQLNNLNETVSYLQASSASHFHNAEKFTS